MQQIVPAILTETIDDLNQQLSAVNGLSTEIQIDFVDGLFIHHKTILPADLKELKTTSKIQAHLMVKHPELYFDKLRELHFRTIIFHFETTKKKTASVAAALKVHHLQIGLAINPITDVKEIKPYLDEINLVNILTVEPGYQGHELLPYTLAKVEQLKEAGFRGLIQLDGGINEATIDEARATGADQLVIGSAIVGMPDPRLAYQRLAALIS